MNLKEDFKTLRMQTVYVKQPLSWNHIGEKLNYDKGTISQNLNFGMIAVYAPFIRLRDFVF